MTARKRVAITGLGLVTPVGNDVATTWDAVLHGKSGGAPITVFDASGFPVHIAAEAKGFDDVAQLGDRKLLKLTNRSHRFALAAAEQALASIAQLRIVVAAECPVGAVYGRARVRAQVLVHRIDITERRTAVEHVVP